MAAKLLADGESWDCINVAIQTMAAREVGVEGGTDLFGNALEDEAFWDFVAKYVVGRRNELAKDALFLRTNVGKRNSSTMTKKYGVDLKDPESLKKALKEIDMLRERWKNPYVEADLMEEIKRAWQEKQEGEGKAAAQVFERYAQMLRERESGVTDYSTREEEKRYRVENDKVGLSARLNEKVKPVEINFTGDLEKEMEDYAKAHGLESITQQAYSREVIAEVVLELAEKYPDGLEIEGGKFRVKFPKGRNKTRNVAGKKPSLLKTQVRSQLEEMIVKSAHISSREPDITEDTGRNKKKAFKWVKSIEGFGCLIKINGEEKFFWYKATSTKENPGTLQFYEYGVTDMAKKEAAVATRSPLKGDNSHETASEDTLGEVLSRVKDKNVVDVKKDSSDGEEVTDYSVRRAEEDALRAHWQENYDGRPPEGWYVHGRHGRKDLDTGNVVLATQDNTVALQYSGIPYAGAESDGSVWYIRPREGERLIDMRTEEGREAVREFVRDCVEDNDELYTMAQRWARDHGVDMYTDDGEVRKDVIEGVVDTFDPTDIVDSAEAYDLPELMGAFWEYVGAPMVVTSRGGAVVLDREGVDAVMVDDGRGAYPVTDYSVAGMKARTAAANMDKVYRDPADGKEKFVIPTANARLSTGFTLGQLKSPVGGHKDASLGAILEYPELYEAYPELRNMRVRLYNPKMQDGTGGFFARPQGKEAGYLALNTGVGMTPERVLETLLHESQHAIQTIEGHAIGAWSMSVEDALAYLKRAIKLRKAAIKAGGDDAWNRENLAYLESMVKMVQGKEGAKMQDMALSHVYWYSHGEQEARFTGSSKDGDPMAEGRGMTENSPTTWTIAVPGEATELGGVTFGGMGRFSYLLESRLGTAGDFNYDRAVYQMKEAVVRRMRELRMLGDSRDERARGVQLAAEALATMESLESLLPATYRFGLEAYKVYFSSYAKLAESGSAAEAGRMVPMTGWDERMRGAYEKIARTVVEGHFYQGDMEFWGEHWKKVEKILPPLQERWEEFMRTRVGGLLRGKARQDAINAAWRELRHELPEEMRTLMQAVGEVRADKLMAKFMERVALQLDAFRKDKTLGRIRRVVGALKPGAKENGKPVKGRMDAERYRKVVDMVRLMELTRGERELFERERYTGEGTEKAWEDLEPNDTVTVRTYDGEGKAVEIVCSKEEFETYACFETMTASQAEAASRALGEYIATGRQAWDNAQEAARRRIAELCAPALDKYGETENELKARRERQQRKAMPLVKRTLNFLGFGLNDAQFFDACSKVPEIEKWTKDAVYRIASAHTYIEAKERDRQDFMTRAAREASGEKDDKKVREWLDDTRRNRDTGIKLVEQRPPFYKLETEKMRLQFMGLLRRKTHKKNFNPNTFAEALRYLTEEDGLMPEAVAREAMDKYGTLGDAKASRLKGKEALMVLLTDNEYARFSDLTKTAQNRAEAAREKWRQEREQEAARRKEEGKPTEKDDPFSKSFAQRVIAAFSGQKQPKKKDIFTLCKYPVLLQQLKPWGGNVHINWENMYKLSTKHYLTPEQIARLPKDLNQPVAVLEDFDGSLLVVADMTAPTRESMKKYEGTGNKGDIVRRNVRAVLKLKKSNKTGVDVVDMSSAYAPDKSDKLAGLLKQRKLLYLDKTRAGEWANKEESTISPLLRTLLASPDSGVMVKETSPDVKQNNEETLVLSPAQAAYRVLLCEQADYTESLSMQGYTPEVVQQLREFFCHLLHLILQSTETTATH